MSPVVGNARGRGRVFVNWGDALKGLIAVSKARISAEDAGCDEGENFSDARIGAVIVKGEGKLV